MDKMREKYCNGTPFPTCIRFPWVNLGEPTIYFMSKLFSKTDMLHDRAKCVSCISCSVNLCKAFIANS